MDLLLFLLILIIPAIAQILVTTNYSKYKAIENDKKLTGFDVARKILDKHDLKDIYVVETRGNLTDHYDSKRKVIRLSSDIFHGSTIASLAVAAHECGHAIQDKDNYSFMRLRSLIFPIVNVATSISYFIIFLGVLFQSLNLVWLGIAFVSCGLIFQLVTLPVEIDASKRAKNIIKEMNLGTEEEQDGIANMLGAAASTYVAGVLSSALEILRLILIFNNNRDD